MLTESQARELLRLAGETVDVAPSGPLRLPPKRRAWPLLAAAAVLVVVALSAVVIGGRSHDGPPVVEHGQHVPRIPSVFGYTAPEAAAMLEGLGLRATVRDENSCEVAGRALGTSPGTGTAYSRGDAVTVLRSTGTHPLAYCAFPHGRAEAWAFLDFANGRGPAPAFADHVSLWVDGEHTATLTADQAADPAAWGDDSALRRLATDSRQVLEVDGRFVSPVLTNQPDDGTQFVCGGQDLPPALAGRASQMLYVSTPTKGLIVRCAFVNVFRTAGLIDAVVLRTDAGPRTGTDVQPVVPDLVGREIHQARAALRAGGLSVRVEHGPGSNLCLKDERVVSQDPAAGSAVTAGTTVTLRTEWRLCGQSAPRQ